LGLKGADIDAARIANDLDPGSIAENKRFIAAVRRLSTPGAAATQNSGPAVASAVSYQQGTTTP